MASASEYGNIIGWTRKMMEYVSIRFAIVNKDE